MRTIIHVFKVFRTFLGPETGARMLNGKRTCKNLLKNHEVFTRARLSRP